jgi:hypothetical protein
MTSKTTHQSNGPLTAVKYMGAPTQELAASQMVLRATSQEPSTSLPGYVLVEPNESGPSLSNATTSNMTHLPAAMTSMGASSSSGSKRNGKSRTKLAPLAREGQDISKFYNAVAGRPYPKFAKLEQSIRVVDTFTVSSFFTTSTATNAYAAVAFTLSSFSMNSSYVALFDQYRIEQLEVWLEPFAAQGSTAFAELITAVDLDDANVPANLSLGDKQGALVGYGAAGRYHRWRPHVAVAEYSGTFTSYGNVPATWIDSASTTVQHYGFKIAAFPTPLQTVTYGLTVRAVIGFRSPGL